METPITPTSSKILPTSFSPTVTLSLDASIVSSSTFDTEGKWEILKKEFAHKIT